MNNPRYECQIAVNDEMQTIISTVDFVGPDYNGVGIDNVRQIIMRNILDTRDQQVRDALIHLGWTPPKDRK